ncbi:hypothetical protein NUU61_007509 [Penicillium alfredii]|uniref:Uncharacterized protein n=1 Tax=Penicillium alfredii TaxID=1506179 RepID=A0A9W9K4D5_9EURO|nr:uncharacterized protein NUU61_007509 [Penicillium alfredii]KAJ5092639.1 hypothetical protein NUU61_007509 [Penicillium alfredii]
MSGMAGDTASTDEASSPIDTNVSNPDTLAGRGRESASNTREKIANRFQLGDNKATTRRLSDTPESMRRQFREFSPRESAKESAEKGKSMWQSAQETVAKALGGGSRGSS